MNHLLSVCLLLPLIIGCQSESSSDPDPGSASEMGMGMTSSTDGGGRSSADGERPLPGDIGTVLDGAVMDMAPPATDAGPMTMAKPNIILIVIDDMGYGDVGYHGSEIETPVIDALVGGGVRLDRFYTFPLCGPTRKGLVTGRSPVTMESIKNPRPNDAFSLPVEEHLISQTLGAFGYQNWIVGKWHLGGVNSDEFLPAQRGFDHFYGHVGAFIDSYTHRSIMGDRLDWQRNGEPIEEMGYSTDLMTDEAITLLGARDAERPFFLYLAYNAVHTPLAAPENLVEKYSFIDGERRQTYAAMLDAVDGNIGRLLAAVDAQGIRENTLIFFMSDNGGNEGMGGANNDPFRGVKGQVFEGGIRVAAGVNWPGVIEPGQLSEDFFSILDVYPTLVGAAGLEPQGNLPLDGRNLFDEIQNDVQTSFDEYIVAGNNGVALFEGEWKLIRSPNGDGPMLFNIVGDPSEASNVAADHLERVDQMLSAIAERTAAITDQLD